MIKVLDGTHNIYFIFSLLDFIGILDTAVLNHASSLEHLENAFYAGALARFDAKDFQNAGLESGVCPLGPYSFLGDLCL